MKPTINQIPELPSSRCRLGQPSDNCHGVFCFFIDMANALIDNSEQFKLVKYIKELVSRPDCNHIMIATGYWDLPGTALIYEELKDFFARGGKLDLLIGQEPQLQYYQASQEVRQFPDFYIQRDVDSLTDEFKPIGNLIIDNALTEENPNGKFEIRVYGQVKQKKFLHAKCYIFLGNNHTLATGIVGSSNFTFKGLQVNAELNYLEENGDNVAAPFTKYSTSKSHKAWFEELWQNSELWSGRFINGILKQSPIGKKIEKDKEFEKQNVASFSTDADIKPDPIVEHTKRKKGDRRVVTNASTRLRITMPDGSTIEERTAWESLYKFVLTIGADKVRAISLAIGLKINRIPLISNTVDEKYKRHQKPLGNGWLLMTNSSTPRKRKQILAIAEAIGLIVNVDII